jgi:LEA14-like dessication related protein
MSRFLSLIGLIVLISSCAALQKLTLKEPEIEYQSVKMQGLDFNSVSLLFDFAVINPNDLDLEAKAYNWNMSIGGREFVSGLSESPLTVNGKSTSIVQVPVRLGFQELFAAFGDLLSNDSVPYEVNLNADLDVPVLGKRSVPVVTKGYIPVPKVPTFAIDNFELTKFSLAGSTVTLKVRVSNPNYFAISMANAAYVLRVNNEEWVNSRLARSIEIMPKSDIVVSIPIDVNMQRWGTTVYRILTRGEEFTYNLAGQGDLSVDLLQFTDVIRVPFGLDGKYKIQQP